MLNEDVFTIETVTNVYYDTIYKYCRRRIANETDSFAVVNDVFIALIEQWIDIDQQYLEGWLYKTAKFKVADYFKDKNKVQNNYADIENFENSIDLSYDMPDFVSEYDLENHHEKILNSLTEKERQLYEDYYINNYSYAQLSEKYGKSEGALRTSVSRISFKIRQMVKEFLTLCLIIILLK